MKDIYKILASCKDWSKHTDRVKNIGYTEIPWEDPKSISNIHKSWGMSSEENREMQLSLLEDPLFAKQAKKRGRNVGLSNKGKPKSDQWKKAASAGMKGKHKGKRWCNKDGINQRVPQDRYDELLKEGWSPGRSWSDKTMELFRKKGLEGRNKQLGR